MEQTALSITEIRIDGGTQMREKLCHDTAERYAEHMRDGDEFPPVTVFFDGSDYWLADGFHRCEAAKQAGVEMVPGDVRQGSRLDAIKYACRANDSNGLSRTKGDLAKSYANAVQFELVEATDVKAVKELLRCSSRAASTLTKPARDKAKQERDAKIVELSEEGKSQREIAEEVGLILPPDALIVDAFVWVLTVSDAATSCVGTLGTASGGAQIVSGADLTTAGRQGTFVPGVSTGTGANLWLGLTYTGAATAVGKYVPTVEYIEYLKNTGEETNFN